MPKIKKIVEDSRPIKSVTTPGECGQWWCVGSVGVTKIEAYLENSQMAEVLWLAIYKGDDIVFRVNCAMVEYISYGAS